MLGGRAVGKLARRTAGRGYAARSVLRDGTAMITSSGSSTIYNVLGKPVGRAAGAFNRAAPVLPARKNFGWNGAVAGGVRRGTPSARGGSSTVLSGAGVSTTSRYMPLSPSGGHAGNFMRRPPGRKIPIARGVFGGVDLDDVTPLRSLRRDLPGRGGRPLIASGHYHHGKSYLRSTTPNPRTEAKKGKNISRMVAGGVAGAAIIGGVSNRNGRAVDPMAGRPTGVYGF
jgi:hypothetical protein